MSLADLAGVATVASFAAPLLLAACMSTRLLRPWASALAPWAALPALLLAVALGGVVTLEVDWALFGMRLGILGAVTPAFLYLTASLWLASGVFARTSLAEDPHRDRFWQFFLVTAAGNIGLVIARDVASFYVFYVLMTFAAYGLVVHEGTPAARRAGRVYLGMALVGEMMILTAFLLIVRTRINVGLDEVPRFLAASERREIIALLLLLGFGIKAGAPLLHVWLPLAHPVAPTPASAVLSGAMIKAGLLGWLRFLPLGAVALPAHGLACAIAGVSAAFLAVAIGLTQRSPKTILAYSSVSQMGFLTATLGIGLADPSAAPAAVLAIVFYATHHALAKGALFLGTGVAKATASGWPGRLVTFGLALLALGIAGAPLSSGALAKISLKNAASDGPWAALHLPLVLSAAAVGSTLIMVHFLRRTLPRAAAPRVPKPGLWLPWATLLVLDLALLAWPRIAPADVGLLVRPEKLWASAWPVLAGIVLAALFARVARSRSALARVTLPAGDVLRLVELAVARLQRSVRVARAAARPRSRGGAHRGPLSRLSYRLLEAAERTEVALARFATIGLLFLVLVFLFLAGQLLSVS